MSAQWYPLLRTPRAPVVEGPWRVWSPAGCRHQEACCLSLEIASQENLLPCPQHRRERCHTSQPRSRNLPPTSCNPTRRRGATSATTVGMPTCSLCGHSSNPMSHGLACSRSTRNRNRRSRGRNCLSEWYLFGAPRQRKLARKAGSHAQSRCHARRRSHGRCSRHLRRRCGRTSQKYPANIGEKSSCLRSVKGPLAEGRQQPRSPPARWERHGVRMKAPAPIHSNRVPSPATRPPFWHAQRAGGNAPRTRTPCHRCQLFPSSFAAP
mmetsp:Transcript_68371/g.172326  ORF Transcript_68371/g.172326 Transcript_68371/m.172326 type:complete len:266 (+) Transcript_68371:323-1120(+)